MCILFVCELVMFVCIVRTCQKSVFNLIIKAVSFYYVQVEHLAGRHVIQVVSPTNIIIGAFEWNTKFSFRTHELCLSPAGGLWCLPQSGPGAQFTSSELQHPVLPWEEGAGPVTSSVSGREGGAFNSWWCSLLSTGGGADRSLDSWGKNIKKRGG